MLHPGETSKYSGEIMRVVAVLAALFFAVAAEAKDPSLADLAFLEGHWRGGDDSFVFEESWLPAEGGVMTGMARGVGDGALRVLEYIVVSEEDGGVFMRFHHYKADMSTWEEEPIVLRLEKTGDGMAEFRADETDTVPLIRYFVTEDGGLQADVETYEDGERDSFSLTFSRVSE